jgi:hypothetical protein
VYVGESHRVRASDAGSSRPWLLHPSSRGSRRSRRASSPKTWEACSFTRHVASEWLADESAWDSSMASGGTCSSLSAEGRDRAHTCGARRCGGGQRRSRPRSMGGHLCRQKRFHTPAPGAAELRTKWSSECRRAKRGNHKGREATAVPGWTRLQVRRPCDRHRRDRAKMSHRSPRTVTLTERERAPFAEHYESLPIRPLYRSAVTTQLRSGVTLRDLIEREREGS